MSIMSLCKRKQNEDDDDVLETDLYEVKKVTYYDEYGMLRRGPVKPGVHDRDEELDIFLALEEDWKNFSEEEQRTWFIVESGWIKAWLQYVREGNVSLGESQGSPTPGPVNNESLMNMAVDLDRPHGTAECENSDLQTYLMTVNGSVWGR
jgi:hypothetical protein